MEILADAMPDKAAIPRSTDGMVDIQSLLRLLAEQVVNAIMDEEADQLCGDGANSRNGYRDRSLETCVGTLNLRIPKLRTGSFFPEDVLERYQRVDRALVAAVAEMYATGTSTRKVQRIAEKMGIERLGRDRVSAIAATLDAEIADLAEGPLDARAIPYIWLDATYVKCRRGGRVASTAVVTAIGCDESGWRRVLGVSVVDTESYESWLGFLRKLRDRGATGTELVVSDAHGGLVRAIGEVFQGGGLAAMRRAPDARLHARGRLLAAEAPRGAHRLLGLPRQGRRHRRGHVPRGMRDAGGVLPEGGKGARGGGARRARVPGLPAVALEAPAHQQRAGARQQGNQAPLARGAGLPVGEFAAQARGRRHVRPGRDMVRLALLLGEEDGRDA